MNAIAARYASRFECTGSACPDTCCSGLTIALSEMEVVHLKRGPRTPEYMAAIEAEVQPPPPGRLEDAYAVLAHPSGSCAFLDEEKLCSVQKHLGPEGLNETCRDYPRQASEYDGEVQVMGSLGCPEMARLCLTDPQALKFEGDGGSIRPRARWKQDPTREGIVGLLTQDELPVSHRFAAVALSLDAAASLTEVALTTRAVAEDHDNIGSMLEAAAVDSLVRAVIGRDALMARRPRSRHEAFCNDVDQAAFVMKPTETALEGFFSHRSPLARRDEAIADALDGLHAHTGEADHKAYALAVSRYAGWRWMTSPPDDLAAAKKLWGRILLEVAAVDVLRSANVSTLDAFQRVARELVAVPDLSVLFDRYVEEQKLTDLLGQVAARPGAAGSAEARAERSAARSEARSRSDTSPRATSQTTAG